MSGTALQTASCLTSRQVARWLTSQGNANERPQFDPAAFVRTKGRPVQALLMTEGLGEWDDELEDSHAPKLFYRNVAASVSERLALASAGHSTSRAAYLVSALVEARRSHQPPRNALAHPGIPAPGRPNRDERLVARPRKPSHVHPALNRRTLQRLHPRRRAPHHACPANLRRTAKWSLLTKDAPRNLLERRGFYPKDKKGP